jgi:hypothetical protein
VAAFLTKLPNKDLLATHKARRRPEGKPWHSGGRLKSSSQLLAPPPLLVGPHPSCRTSEYGRAANQRRPDCTRSGAIPSP